MSFKLPCQDEKYVMKIIKIARRLQADEGLQPVGYKSKKRLRLKLGNYYVRGVFTDGDCGNFYTDILKPVFKCAKPYSFNNGSHIKTKIGDAFYDVEGKDILGTYKTDGPASDELVEDCSNNFKAKHSQVPWFIARAEEKLRIKDSTFKIKDYIKTDEFLK